MAGQASVERRGYRRFFLVDLFFFPWLGRGGWQETDSGPKRVKRYGGFGSSVKTTLAIVMELVVAVHFVAKSSRRTHNTQHRRDGHRMQRFSGEVVIIEGWSWAGADGDPVSGLLFLC
jgi:hypothetical protein